MAIQILGYGSKSLANPSTTVNLTSGQGWVLPPGEYQEKLLDLFFEKLGFLDVRHVEFGVLSDENERYVYFITLLRCDEEKFLKNRRDIFFAFDLGSRSGFRWRDTPP